MKNLEVPLHIKIKCCGQQRNRFKVYFTKSIGKIVVYQQ